MDEGRKVVVRFRVYVREMAEPLVLSLGEDFAPSPTSCTFYNKLTCAVQHIMMGKF